MGQVDDKLGSCTRWRVARLPRSCGQASLPEAVPGCTQQPQQVAGTPLPPEPGCGRSVQTAGLGWARGRVVVPGWAGRQLGKRAVVRRLPYHVESWLFMSPLKCSNFFSVSSLKEPPEGRASETSEWQTGRSALPMGGAAGLRHPGATTLHQVACWGHQAHARCSGLREGVGTRVVVLGPHRV